MAKYKLALLLQPSDPSLQLELGISYALRARAEGRALDYESALEWMLESSGNISTPECVFDSALLFEEVPLLHQARDSWKKAIATETSANWSKEALQRLIGLEKALQDRERRIHGLTDSPISYLAHAKEAQGSVELVIGEALANWLPLLHSSADHQRALEHLASQLKDQYNDPWLADLLQLPKSSTGERALRALSASWNANQKGEYLRAGVDSSSAEKLFRQLSNPAGELRARVERVYALDRVWREKECMDALRNVRASAHSHNYVWIEGQARLEEVSCLTETRRVDVIVRREQAKAWVNKTRYEALRLRGQSFLTEQYGGIDSRLRIWEQGRESLLTFWNQALPPIRGYFSYYSLATTAHSVENRKASLALLHEGIGLLEESPNFQLLGLVLSDLGNWETEDGLLEDADRTFSKMDRIFAKLDRTETERFWRESQITRAEAEFTSARPRSALDRLHELTKTIKFPYLGFGPTERRRLLPVFGNAYLAVGDLASASRYFLQILGENRNDLIQIRNRAQRDNAQREVESAWKGLTEVQLRQGHGVESLSTWEAFRGGWLADPYPKTIVVPNGVALLVYAVLQKGVSAWLVSSHGVEQRWLSENDVRHASVQFSALAADRDAPLPSVEASSRILYHLLIEPFSTNLPESGLLIIDADHELAAVPWAALEAPSGATLLERFSLSQIQSWAEISTDPARSFVNPTTPLIIAEPMLGAELAHLYRPLPQALFEAELLRKMLPHAVYYQGAQATVNAITVSTPSASMLHFAGHGISYGGFGALLLAPSPSGNNRPLAQLLTAEEIGKMKLPQLSLAVLAACSSGEGEMSGSANLDSLVRGFINAGTTRVIAARWNVDSLSTTDLMTQFYELLLKKRRPAEALRDAALTIRKNPLTAHPYYWAGFQVFGTP